jgi:RNA polymerase sigma factor (TIGR02999 family)
METEPGEVTRLLQELRHGNRQAEDLLIPIVYNKLRRIAAAFLRREHAVHSLQATVLVHEAYLRLTRIEEIDWQSRSHFFRISARLMHNILVDHARAQNAKKRGEGLDMVSFNEVFFASPERHPDILAVDQALGRLARIKQRPADVVEMRFFAGMTEDEIAAALGIASRTVKRDWEFAKAWLYNELTQSPQPKSTLLE